MSKAVSFEEMGGRKSLILINKIFYDKIYAHPWLKKFFEKIPQQNIENQQVDFMQKVLGGQNIYAGKTPPVAHMHIVITEEIFEVRKQLLIEALDEANANQHLIDKWLNLDQSFKRVLLKEGPSQCKRRYKTDEILHFPKP